MKKIKIGFMPLYIKLYDDCGLQDIRDRLEPFYEKMAKDFEEKGKTLVFALHIIAHSAEAFRARPCFAKTVSHA